MPLSKKEVEHIGELARLELTEAEKKKFTRELSAILDFVEKLEKIKTSKVEPMANISGLENIIRKDEVKKCDISSEKLLENAPEKEKGFIKVRQVLE